jgi:hypothetical protein
MGKLLALLLTLLAPSVAQAAVILHLHGAGPGGPDISVKDAPAYVGATVTIHATLEVTGGESVIGLGFWLTETPSTGFSITLRTLDPGSPYSTPTSSNAQVTNPGSSIAPAGPDNLLDPANDRDLGVHLPNLNSIPGNQVQHLLEIVLTVPSAPGGTPQAPVLYPIVASHSGAGIGFEWVDANFDAHPFDGTVADRTFTVKLVPEPSSALLVALGLVVVGALRSRPARG